MKTINVKNIFILLSCAIFSFGCATTTKPNTLDITPFSRAVAKSIASSDKFAVEYVKVLSDSTCRVKVLLAKTKGPWRRADYESELETVLEAVYSWPGFPCGKDQPLQVVSYINYEVANVYSYKYGALTRSRGWNVYAILISDPERRYAKKPDDELLKMRKSGAMTDGNYWDEMYLRKLIAKQQLVTKAEDKKKQRRKNEGFVTRGKPEWFTGMEKNLGVVLFPEITEIISPKGEWVTGLLIEEIKQGSVLMHKTRKGDIIVSIGSNAAWDMASVKNEVEGYGIHSSDINDWARLRIPIGIHHIKSGKGGNFEFRPPIQLLAQAELQLPEMPAWCKGKTGFYERIPDFQYSSGYSPGNDSGGNSIQLNKSKSIRDDASNAVKSIANARAIKGDIAGSLSSIRSMFWRAWADDKNQPELEREYGYWLLNARQFNSSKSDLNRLVGGAGTLLGGDDINLGPYYAQRELFEYLAINPCSPLKNPDNKEYLRSVAQAMIYNSGNRKPTHAEIEALINKEFGEAVNDPDFEKSIIIARNSAVGIASNPGLDHVSGALRLLRASKSIAASADDSSVLLNVAAKSALSPFIIDANDTEILPVLKKYKGRENIALSSAMNNGIHVKSVSFPYYDEKITHHFLVSFNKAWGDIVVFPIDWDISSSSKRPYFAAIQKIKNGNFLDAYIAYPIIHDFVGITTALNNYHANRGVSEKDMKELKLLLKRLVKEPVFVNRSDNNILPLLFRNINNKNINPGLNPAASMELRGVSVRLHYENLGNPLFVYYDKKTSYITACEFDSRHLKKRELRGKSVDQVKLYYSQELSKTQFRRTTPLQYMFREEPYMLYSCGTSLFNKL